MDIWGTECAKWASKTVFQLHKMGFRVNKTAKWVLKSIFEAWNTTTTRLGYEHLQFGINPSVPIGIISFRDAVDGIYGPLN
jgi:hypothetical protein